MKKIIHINQHNIRKNKQGENLPVITCKTYKENIKVNNLSILDKEGIEVVKIVYSPDKPLSCGATVWIETYNEVKIN